MSSKETAQITPFFGLQPKIESEIVKTVEKIIGQIGQMSIFQKMLYELEIPKDLIEDVRNEINSAFKNKGLVAEPSSCGLKIVNI